jgi:gliding motility-associated lipoprotein GldH
MRKILFIGALALALSACQSDLVYSRFIPISSGDWHKDSVLLFCFPVADTTVNYAMDLYVRHTERYAYQNIWLFVQSQHRDTVNGYLADDRGRWLGDHQHGLTETRVMNRVPMHFSDSGTYSITVQHAMRDTILRNVMEIGVEVYKQR